MTMPFPHSPLTIEPAGGPASAAVRRLSVAQAREWLESKTPVLVLDVREGWEYDLGHIAGAKLAPLSTLPAALQSLGLASDQPVLTYCHHGLRSVKAAEFLQAHGMANVASMDGGIDAWAQQVDPSVGRY